MQQGNGALVVLGSGPGVDELCTGGFQLTNSPFTPARLAELAKMDGAIVLDDDCTHILRANVHLLPNASIPTDETGARHRTAERVAGQTGKPVVAVSEDRRLATLFLVGEKHELESPTALAAKGNQSLQTLERFRRRLDDARERLTRLEVADVATYRAVVVVMQRVELVRRIGREIERDAVNLGGEGDLIRLQLGDLLHGVDELRLLTLRDYVRPDRSSRLAEAAAALEAVPTGELNDPARVAASLGFDDPEEQVRPLGVRVLHEVPRLPEPVREAVIKHFRDFQKMLIASLDELDKVEGIGSTRALQLRHYFDRLIDATRAWGPDVG